MEPRFKSENYENLGGINTKASQYLTGPREFLQLYNYDFSVPGSLTKRPGSTQYIGQTFVGKITGLAEFSQSSGFSQFVVSATGGIWAGSTRGTLQGLSMQAFGTTMGYGNPGNYSPAYLLSGGGAAGPWASTGGAPYYDDGWMFSNPGYLGSSLVDSVIFQDRLFLSNGSVFAKYDGSTLYRWGFPRPQVESASSQGTSTGAATGYFPAGFIYYLAAAYVNSRNVVGPPSVIAKFNAIGGASAQELLVTLSAPEEYGIKGAWIYLARGATTVSNDSLPNMSQFQFWKSFTLTVGTSNNVQFGYIGLTNGALPTGTTFASSYFPLGETFATGAVSATGFSSTSARYQLNNAANPRYLEIFSNRLFMAGWNDNPSRVWFSELAEPELVDPTYFFEARTQDGDVITCMKSYYNKLLIFKYRSTHELSGDGPSNFSLRQITEEYGCLNNRCAITFEGRCWYLDKKGIVEYNGNNPLLVSWKVEEKFQAMNQTAAISEAVMCYVKSRNEIWCAIPVNGSTVNNLTIVYDLVTQSWTYWDGFNPGFFNSMRGPLTQEAGFYGDYSGRVNYFDTQFYGDNGAGITCLIKSRFEAPLGQSSEKQFRRLFINADSLTGATLSMGVNLYSNYATTIAYGFTAVQNAFQKYSDFGVSAKSLAIQISHFSAVDALRLHGYTLEYRFQRSA